ncbi:MAG: hypothetical protein ACYC3X_31235 [Pirellulaceae bacterium]
MPKKFPDPAPNVHPVAVECPPLGGDPLADLLWSGADHADVAEYLRVHDEPNANKLAEYLQAIVKATPVFQAAIRDGEGAAERQIEAKELLLQLQHLRPQLTFEQLGEFEKRVVVATADVKRYGLLASAYASAVSILGGLATGYPALFRDPRCELAAKSADPDQVNELRVAIMNFLRDNKLEIEVIDGWPRSVYRRSESRGTVKLVTVAEKGLRVR